MNSPTPHEVEFEAPVPVRRPKRNWLRRHWLTGALIFGLVGFVGYLGRELLAIESRLEQARQTRQELEVRLQEARRRNEELKENLAKVKQDSYMELMARSLGFVYPHETVYQQGAPKGR
jgi:cell division protein FtsB